MDRNEHLHIRKDVLIKILSDIDYNKTKTPNQLAEDILNAAKNLGVTDFYKQFLNIKTKTKEKIKRTMEAETPNATVEEFNRVLMNFRLSNKNKYSNKPVRLILKDSPDYLMLKEIAKLAQTFVDDFEITSKTEGYKEFLEIGYTLMGKKFFLNKYKTYNSKIHEIFQSKVDVLMDDTPDETKLLYKYWQQYMVDYADLGELIDIENDYLKYSHLVYAKDAANDNKADFEDWVVAQFEGLTYMSAVPELYQFHGEGAKNRYERYLRDTAEVSTGESYENTLTNFHKKDYDNS